MADLIERDAQLAQLRACLEVAAGGTGNVALISGEAGIGKTSLVKAIAAERPDVALWWGGCDALGTPNPLAPLHDMAHSAGEVLRTLLAGEARGAVLYGDVIRALQSLGPALVVIEDAHWADGSTLDLVKFIGRRIDRTRAVLVVTFRQDEVSAAHPLRTVMGELPSSLTTRIELPRLSPEAVGTLARQALRSPTGVHAATGGNPFFVTELLRHGSTGIPSSVQDLVLARFARLPEKSREVVQLAAIVPARIERWLVEDMLAPSAADIEGCLDSGLLLADDTSFFFRHELARVSIEKATSLPLSQSLHARALEALARHDVDPAYAARRVHHAIHAKERTAVLDFAPAAARQARERGCHREAAAHYRTVLQFAEGMELEEHVGYLEAYALECLATNQLPEAIAAREEMARLLHGRERVLDEGRNLSELALVLVVALRNAEADRASRRAIRLLEGRGPVIELANAYRAEAQLRMLNRDCAESVEWGRKALELAEQLGNDEVLAATHSTLGAALTFIDYEAGCAELERALAIALDRDLDYVAANTYSNLGSASGELFRLRAARKHLDAAIEFATRKEIDFYRTYALAWMGLCELYLGNWDDAEAYASEALATSGEWSTARVMALCALGRLRVRRGEAGADALLDEALKLALASGTLQRVAPVREARAEAAFQRGDLARVAQEAGAAFDLARRHQHAWHVGELSYWLARAGAKAQADGCAEPYALELSGQWREAASAWAALECPYEHARTLAEGDDEAKLEALAIFERLGAKPAAESLRKVLRDAGVRGVPRGPRVSTQRSPRGLTARESEILELLCQGLKNSEIAERLYRSVRTVEHHVDSILGKLGAPSRGEVAAIARREGLVGGKIGSSRTQIT